MGTMLFGATPDNSQIAFFQTRLLTARGLGQPTGGPLYAYRISNEEFKELRSGLVEAIAYYSGNLRLEKVERRHSWFPALFVLYASEWWRREYDGSGWTWQPIVESIGASPEEWNQARRSQCVEQGFDDWKIRLTLARGFRFLGSIAVQGGLPMNLLATSHGNIGRVLSRVLQLAASSSAGESEVEEWVTAFSSYLPYAYRQQEIYRLLSQVVTTVLSLKRRGSLDLPATAVEKLDRTIPDWRNEFPLPIEDNQAKGLLDQLVKDAANTRQEQGTVLARVDRRLERTDNEWCLRSTIHIPEYIEEAEIKRFFKWLGGEALARFLIFRITAGMKSFDVPARRLAGRDRYRVERRGIELIDYEAASEVHIALISQDGTATDGFLAKGEALEAGLPWLFSAAGENETTQFVKQGGGAIGGSSGIACAGADWRAESLGGQFEPLGSVREISRTVLGFSGAIRLVDDSGASFQVKTAQATLEEEYLGWEGSRPVDLNFQSPALAFRGRPILCRFSQDGSKRAVGTQLSWRAAGRLFTSQPPGICGPVDACWPAIGDLLWRSRIVLLGDSKPIAVRSNGQPNSGKIDFADWDLAGVQSRIPDVDVVGHADGANYCAEFHYQGAGCPPEWCDIELVWRGNPLKARASVPFPLIGARAFDPAGNDLSQDAIIGVEKIFGVRLVGFLNHHRYAVLRLTLRGGEADSGFSSIRVEAPYDSRRINIRLVDYLPSILRMLAATTSLDSYVALELKVGDSEARLRIARYPVALERDIERSLVYLPNDAVEVVTSGQLSALTARATRLDSQNMEPSELLRTSEEDHTVAWTVPTEEWNPGPWLIYPGKDSSEMFRPILWTIHSGDQPPPEENSATLAAVLRVTDAAERQEALKSVIKRLAANYDVSDWALVEQFANEFCHLPLSTLDIWPAFARSADGMCALAFRTGNLPSRFFESFSSEMPCIWETVPLKSWIHAIRAYVQYVNNDSVLVPVLESRIEVVSSVCPSLRALLEIAQSVATGTCTDGVRAAELAGTEFFTSILFTGVDSPYQMLLRDGAEVNWPTSFRADIMRCLNEAQPQLVRSDELVFRQAVVHLPILLAVAAVKNTMLPWLGDLGLYRTLRQYQNFNPEWFSEAFDLTVAQCIAQRMIAE